MRLRWRYAALLAAITGLVAPLQLGSAQAATITTVPKPWPVVGTLQSGITGIPKIVKRGTVVNGTFWYRQQSPVMLAPIVWSVQLWSAKTGVPDLPQPGISVSWLNPATNRWTPSNAHYSPGDFEFYAQTLKQVPSNYWAHISLRISFSSAAALGGWSIQCADPGYELQFSSGTLDRATLRDGATHVYQTTLVR